MASPRISPHLLQSLAVSLPRYFILHSYSKWLFKDTLAGSYT